MPPNDHYGKPMQRRYSNNRQPQYHQKMGQNRSNGPSMQHQQIRMQNQRYQSPNDNQYHQDDMPPIQEQYMQQDYGQAPMSKHPVRFENQGQKNQNNLNQRRDSREYEQYQDPQERQDRQDQRRMQPTNSRKPVFNNEGQEIFEVYVHNVDFEVTANDVVNQFRHCGPIDHWKFPRKDATRQNHGRHKGYGFIFFKTMKGQINALNMRRNPPYIGNRHINISDNANQHIEEDDQRFLQEDQRNQDQRNHEDQRNHQDDQRNHQEDHRNHQDDQRNHQDDQRFHQDDPYLNQNRPNLRETLSRPQDSFYGRYEPMDRFQRYEGPPRMMERYPEQRDDLEPIYYQKQMDHYCPPRNMDHGDDLRGGEMVMQKYQSTRDYDRGRINPNRQFQDEQSEDQQYRDRNPNSNLVVIKKSNDNFQEQQDQYPLNIKKKSDGENEQNETEQNWQGNELNEVQDKDQNQDTRYQTTTRQVQQLEEEVQPNPKSIQDNSNVQENKENQDNVAQSEQEPKEVIDQIEEQSEKKSNIVEELDVSKKETPENDDLKLDQTIGTPNENKQETKEDNVQLNQNNTEQEDQNQEKQLTENLNPETAKQNDVQEKDLPKDQISEGQKETKQNDDTQERNNEKKETNENRNEKDGKDGKDSKQKREYQDQKDNKEQRQERFGEFQPQRMQQMPPNNDELNMSRSDSCQGSKPENTNKYNPNNREFIGYKSDILHKQHKDTRENTDSRHNRDNRDSRDNRDTRDTRDNRDNRSRGNDQDRQMNRNNSERMMRGGPPREMRNNDPRRDDPRRMETFNPQLKKMEGNQRPQYMNTVNDNNHMRKDDYYGRQPQQRVNDRMPEGYIQNRNPKEMNDMRHDNGQYGPQRLDQRYNDDERRLNNKRSYNQMDMDFQGYHDDPNKRQRRQEENTLEDGSHQQRQIEKRDSVDGRQMDMMNDSRSMAKNDQNDRQKQYKEWKNHFNENRNIDGEYDSDSRYNQQNYRQRQMDDKSKDKRKYNNTSPERLNYEKQLNDDVVIDNKNKQYELNQALDLYGEDDNNYNIHEQQSSNQDHFDNYDELENKSISFHEQLNEEKQKNKQKYRNK